MIATISLDKSTYFIELFHQNIHLRYISDRSEILIRNSSELFTMPYTWKRKVWIGMFFKQRNA